MRYQVSGCFTWDEVVRHTRRFEIDAIVEGDTEYEAKDAEERRENERMMHSLGISTLFEVAS